MMASLGLFLRRQLPPALAHYARVVKLRRRPPCAGAPLLWLRRLHGPSRLRNVEKGPWGKSRGPELQQQQYPLTDLDKADALVGSARDWFLNKLKSKQLLLSFPPQRTYRLIMTNSDDICCCHFSKPPLQSVSDS